MVPVFFSSAGKREAAGSRTTLPSLPSERSPWPMAAGQRDRQAASAFGWRVAARPGVNLGDHAYLPSLSVDREEHRAKAETCVLGVCPILASSRPYGFFPGSKRFEEALLALLRHSTGRKATEAVFARPRMAKMTAEKQGEQVTTQAQPRFRGPGPAFHRRPSSGYTEKARKEVP
jgi:hypothetical protein